MSPCAFYLGWDGCWHEGLLEMVEDGPQVFKSMENFHLLDGDDTYRTWWKILKMSLVLLTLSSKKLFLHQFIQRHTMGIYRLTKTREQCSAIRKFDEILTFMVNGTTVSTQNK